MIVIFGRSSLDFWKVRFTEKKKHTHTGLDVNRNNFDKIQEMIEAKELQGFPWNFRSNLMSFHANHLQYNFQGY